MALIKKKFLNSVSEPQEKRPPQILRDCLLTDKAALHWAKMPSWSLQEAIYLARNKDPICAAAIVQPVNHKTVKIGKYSTIIKRSISDTVIRAYKVGDLRNHVSPDRFVEWSYYADLKLPDVLVAAVMSVHPNAKDWKAEFNRTREELTQQIAQNASLKSENEQLKRALKNDQLGTKEKASVYKILAGLAYKHGYNPKSRNGSTSVFLDSVLRIGLEIHEDNVRDKIKAACEMYHAEIKKNSGSVVL